LTVDVRDPRLAALFLYEYGGGRAMLTPRDLSQLGIDPERRKFRTLLDDLQGNILKPHGRDHARLIFFTIERGRAQAARAWIRTLADGRVTSARRQLQEADAHRKKRREPEKLFCTFLLSAAGYRALGADLRIPSDAKFRAGMKRSRASLRDPEPRAWQAHYRGEIHGLVLLAHQRSSALVRYAARIRREMRSFTQAVWVERGRQLHRGRQVIEHFGYADGISQPLFLTRDMTEDRESSGGYDTWNPSAPLRLVLARDPNGRTADPFGSYLVYRKLEQDVPLFMKKQTDMTRALQVRSPYLPDSTAGALMIGRFPNGTPVKLQREAAQKVVDLENNFAYGDDPRGSRCPFQAHTRAANPRTLASRHQRIVRRGISYGRRTPSGSRGVGLLFMCLQRSIGSQFEQVQRRMNGRKGHARDPITGQGSGGAPPLWPAPYAESSRLRYPPRASRRAWQKRSPVRLLGGEYFFAPSLSFLTGL
jgi:Dyp-type peroxidase family